MEACSSTVIAFLVTTSLLLVLRPLADAVGLMDRPGGRKTHRGVIPVVGGIAMFGGVIIAATMSDQLQRHGNVVLLAASLMVLIGALDDRFDLKPQFRLFAHAVAAIALTYGSGFVVRDLGSLLGFGDIPLGWLALPFTVVSCMALINAFNMLDGMDGLAGGCALVAFLGFATVALAHSAPTSAIMSLSLAGACLGFLLFNVPVRFNRGFRTFMGDAGSTLLGFVLAAVALILVQPTQADVPPAIVLWIMPIPIFELFTSTVRRIVKGLSPMQADNGHFHHTLVNAGFSVRLIFAIYIGVSALSALVAILALEEGVAEPVVFLLFLVFFAAWLGFVRLAPAIARSVPHRMRREPEHFPH